ncbi:TonB-dependent receptor [Endozoicomonas sp. G2_1]|uniref:TonB-dependent receptor domain-containing protein n=1 Tax=Endozoicomonas sp. G2_1 TaxID=2821091 RepID=UPI001AD9AA17|nr:TonB-dependent receptor [Endozoicomonas sp. G2_1]MBO9489268.1 TonB-dependent receptor [Endozoicomonas sp. G2_1]
MKTPSPKSAIALAVLSALSMQAFAEDDKVKTEDQIIEEITVVGKSVSYANNETPEEMFKQQTAMTSALAVIDNLPGVLINEGDTFGADDWSTTVSVRGFQLSLDEQQIGITIDGIANGNSNYGGGAKANRYIDTENLGTVQVSQGTADIASRSHEALGGTLNFTTTDPESEEKATVSLTLAEFDGQKFFARYDTGEIFKDTYAWFSLSSTESSDFIQQAAENTRDHYAAKVISIIDDIEFTGYFSYDDTHEDNYQRVSLAQFNANPEWDRLTEDWAGIPFVDQTYRRGWSTLRENIFAYLKAEYVGGTYEVSGNVYYHDNSGRGDWVPPYVVDVTDDGANQPHSELVSGNTVFGGTPLGQIGYVTRDGVGLTPVSLSCSSLTAPYGGTRNDDPSTPNVNEASNLHLDPNCFPAGSVPVGSYRHTHYGKERFGFNADFALYTDFNDMTNTLRGGIWYEDYERDEYRDWHKIIDSRTSFEFDNTPYWVQYDRSFTVDTKMFYLEDELDMGWGKVRLGAKKFLVDLDRTDNLNSSAQVLNVDSDSDVLFSGGVVFNTGVEGLEFFAGYAENFAAIKDSVLERDASQLTNIEPETADNIDVGLRYSSDAIEASVTYYDISFENRLVFIAPDSPDAGIDFLVGTNGSFINAGGIESTGVEAALTWYISDELTLYSSFTSNDSEYADGPSAFPTGNTVFGSAEDLAVLSLDWQRDSKFAGVSSKWVGERWLDAANTQRLDDYIVTDVYAGVSVESPFEGLQSLEIRFTINNLTDESYLGGVAGQAAWIGAPRTAALNIKAAF